MEHEEPTNEKLGIKPCGWGLVVIMALVGVIELGLLIWWLM